MRELKFRAWDVNGSWTYFELSPKVLQKGVPKPLKSIIKREEGYELMQYTGLKDKNGVEIYEGDIIHAWDKDAEDEAWQFGSEATGVVQFENGAMQLKVSKAFMGVKDVFLHDWKNAEFIEIIGNIYENPDLLS